MTQTARGQPRTATLDELFAVLSHPTRRRVLAELARHDPDDGDEFGPEAFAPDDADLVLFKERLYHRHFPRLAEAGFVTWDRESNTVSHGEAFGEIEPLLTLLNENEDELPGDWE